MNRDRIPATTAVLNHGWSHERVVPTLLIYPRVNRHDRQERQSASSTYVVRLGTS
jgi:hypothetical protein